MQTSPSGVNVDPPPPDLTYRFLTVKEWLVDILAKNEPEKFISEFKFGLFESSNDYELYLVGVNTYIQQDKPSSKTLIEYRPADMYFKLPGTYFVNLTIEQLIEKLTLDLKQFTSTNEFKNSFLSKASIIVFERNGQTIWTK